MKKLLLVNDSKFETMVLKDFLESQGFNVKTSNEIDYIRDSKVFSPEIIMVNYILKNTTGDLILKYLKELLKDGFISVLTSSDENKLKDLVQKEYIDLAISTPLNQEKIQKILEL